MRNLAGSHRLAAGLSAAAGRWTGPSAASFTWWRFGAAARFATMADLDDAACFGGLACLCALPCFDPLKRSDSQPAWLVWIGRSTRAARAMTTVLRRG